MNDPNGLTAENMMRLYPMALSKDEGWLALGLGTAEALADHVEELHEIGLYDRIEKLPEALLDILAKDMKVDWYDANYTLEEKRATIRGCFRVHRLKGTKAAVEEGLRAVYPDTVAQRWWEYGGEPYHFRLLINSTFERVDRTKHEKIMERLEIYKSLRDVLDEIEYRDAGAVAAACVATACVGCEMTDGAVAVRY